MDEQKQKVIDSLKQANNILVTVKSSPSIDQLAACIALTLIVNELDKHGTAVFSGQVPSVLEFLEPDKTIEKNTDSLRDFIISLDKAKADKLRYKVEDTVVKVFITPYRTSLSADDLEFGQGDFNVDVVVALGVHHQDDLDEAITAHGRILHDATVISVNTEGTGDDELGSINWTDGSVSSLSEMIANIADSLAKDDKTKVIDNQVATALLTGIVAETERFGNAKTTPKTMEVAAKLLTAGANQELVATKLSEPAEQPEPPHEGQNEHDDHDNHDGDQSGPSPSGDQPSDGSDGSNGKGGELSIDHPTDQPPAEPAADNEDSKQLDDAANALSTTFAKEGTDFEVPQEQVPQDEAPKQEKEEVAKEEAPKEESIKDTIPEQPPASEGEVPPVYHPEASHDEADKERPTADGEHQVPDEKAALDFLKERQTGPGHGSRIEPIHSPGEIVNEPKISPAVSDEEGKVTTPGNVPLDPTKFALRPPTLGGTLTANLPSVQPQRPIGVEATTGDIDAPKPDEPSLTPILKHDRPSIVAPETPPTDVTDASATDGEDRPSGEAKPIDAGQTALASTAPKLEAAPADNPPPGSHAQTLADLEKEVHSTHIDQPQVDSKPASGPGPGLEAGLLDADQQPVGAVDMPKPAAPAVSLPAPELQAAPVDHNPSAPTSPPPPVPPPLVSPLGA